MLNVDWNYTTVTFKILRKSMKMKEKKGELTGQYLRILNEKKNKGEKWQPMSGMSICDRKIEIIKKIRKSLMCHVLSNKHTCRDDLNNKAKWMADNNLTLNLYTAA